MRSFIHRLTTPGGFSPSVVVSVAMVAMMGIFVLDISTSSSIRLLGLYVFPLAAIGIHSERLSVVLLGFLMSVGFKTITVISYDALVASKITDGCIAVASSGLAIVLSRAMRKNYLNAVEMAHIDWLTGLHNRRGFEFIADMEMTRQDRYGGAFSIALLDLDNFKTLNDTRGHEVGDQALRLLADVLREKTRQSDSIARLGGDEFVLLMPNTRTTDCNALSRQLTVEIARRMAEAGYPITASIGCVTFDQPPDSLSEALHQADAAMYLVKMKGRPNAKTNVARMQRSGIRGVRSS